MRRAMPWVLVLLLVLVAALGAALGVANSSGISANAWIANVLVRTAGAGSARFSFAAVTTSPSAEEQQSGLTNGEIDFTTGDVREVEVDHQVTFSGTSLSTERLERTTTTEQGIEIGTTQYQDILPSGLRPSWLKIPGQPNREDSLGLSNAGGAAIVLQTITPPETIASVQNRGTTMIGLQPATRYVVTNPPVHACSGAAEPGLGWVSFGPTTLWVDSEGRLVQARLVMHDTGHVPAQFLAKTPQLKLLPMQPSTTTMTLRFTDFGVPVHVKAPPVGAISTQLSRFQVKGTTVIGKCRH